MKKLLAPLIALAMVTPAHALSIVSLHAGGGFPVITSALDATVIALSVLALGAVITYRVRKRKD